MSQVSRSEEEVAFERLLLNAGRTEALPMEQTNAALLRFAAGMGALQSACASSGASSVPTSAGSAAFWGRFSSTFKWATLGFLAGCMATLGWMRREAPLVEDHTPSAAPAADQPEALPNASPQALHVAPVPSSPPSPRGPARATRSTRAASAQALPRSRSSSDLAAEVAALDGIRTALSIGAWQDAERQAERYRRAFPHGALRSEAEVLALEALVAQGRRAAATTAGERFISTHPRDPQVARVRALIE